MQFTSTRTRVIVIHVANDLLLHAARSARAPLLMEEHGAVISYGELAARARKAAAKLQKSGVEAGDRVVLVLPNGIDYLVAYYGVLLAGASAVTLPATITATELGYVLEASRPRCLIAARSLAPGLETFDPQVLIPAGLVDAEDSLDQVVGGGEGIAQIIYTSGTTGQPKGVMLSHRALAANTTSIVAYLNLSLTDRVGVVLDFVYSYGNSLLHTHVRVGGSLALLGNMTFPARVVTLLEQRSCTGFSGVPSTFALLLERGSLTDHTLPHLRYVTCAGGALPPANVQRLRTALPGKAVVLMYGQTEAVARLSYLPAHEIERKAGSIGRGIPGVRLRVARSDGSAVELGEEGEIVAAGENLMSGYFEDQEATHQVLRAGELWTGDLGVVDVEGFIYITGRRNELVKTGSYRVHPLEVEHAIASLEGVRDCVVVGVPDEIWGERLVACFTNGNVPSLATLRAHLKNRLPEFKWPRQVAIVESIPRTASGKPQRRELSEVLTRLQATSTPEPTRPPAR